MTVCTESITHQKENVSNINWTTTLILRGPKHTLPPNFFICIPKQYSAHLSDSADVRNVNSVGFAMIIKRSVPWPSFYDTLVRCVLPRETFVRPEQEAVGSVLPPAFIGTGTDNYRRGRRDGYCWFRNGGIAGELVLN